MMSRIFSLHPAVLFLLAAGAASLLAGCSGKENHKDAGSAAAGSAVADGASSSGRADSSRAEGLGQVGESAAPLGAVNMAQTRSLARSSGCFICHSIKHRVMGPAFAWVSYRFRNDPKAVQTLEHAIRHGISGSWGSMMPMPAQDVTREQAQILARWVLSQTPKAPPQD